MKNKTQGHTPGPWYSAKNSTNSQGLVISETGANIAVTYSPEDSGIVAAAPELLEALKAAERFIQEHVDKNQMASPAKWDILREISAAIAKAEGK